MAKDMKVGLLLKIKDAMTPGVKKASQAMQGMQKKVKTLGSELSNLTSLQQAVRQFKQVEQASRESAKVFDHVQNNVRHLQNALKADPNNQALANKLARAKVASADAEREFSSNRRELKALQSTLKQAGISASNMGDEEKRLAQKIAQTRKTLAGYKQNLSELDQQTKTTRKGMSKLAKSFAVGAAAALGWTGVSGVFSGIKNQIVSLVQTGARFEQLKTQLNSLTGSSKNAEQAMAWIKRFAKNTPSDIESVTKSFVKLKAFGIDPMDGTFQSLIDQTAKLGFSQEKLDGIVLAVGQAWTKQKLQGEEALQLIERGVPVWDLLAKATGKNVVELQKLSTQGKLGRKEIKLLIDEMGKGAQGAAKAQMNSFNGLVSNLKDVWLGFQQDVADAGLLDSLKAEIKGVLKTTSRLAKDGTLKEWAQSISSAFVSTFKAVKLLVSGFVKLLPIITTVTTAFIALKAVNLTKSFLSASSALVGSLIPSMTQAGTTAAVTSGKVGKLGSVLKTISGVFKATIIVEGLKSYYNWYQALRDRQAAEISLAKIEAENIALFKRKIAIGQQMVKENEAYKDTLHLTATELEQLNEVEKKAYQEKLEKQREYYQGQVKILVHQQALGEQVTVDEANIRQALLDTNQALTALDDTFKQTADTTQNTVAPSVNKLIEKFDELESKQHDVGESLQDIYKDVDFTNPKAVADLLELLQKLVDQGELTKEQMQDSLAKVLDTLPADKLQKFMGAVRYASEEINKDLEVSAQALQASIEAVAKELNLDIEKYRSGMSSATKEGIDGFRRLMQSGTKDTRLLGDAFEEAAKRVSTPAGLQALKKVQQEAVKLGIAGAKSMGATVEKTSQRLTDATIQQQQQVEQHTQGLVDTAIEGLDNTSTSAQGVVDVMKTGNVSLEQQAGLLGAMNDASEEAGRKGREAVTVVGKVGETADKSTKSLRSMGSAASVVGVFLNAAKSRLTALSAAAYDTFKNALNIGSATKEAGTLNAKLERTQNKMEELRKASLLNTGGVSSFLNKIATTATRIEGEYYKQKIAAEKLSKSLKDGVVPATALMSKNASRARAQFNLLDKQGLASLVSEIEQAQEKLKAFNQEAKDTLSDLKSELNDLEGNYEAVAKAQAKQREQEIKDKLDEAKKNRNTEAIANLQKSLELIKKINANNIAQAKQRQIDERKQKQEDNTIRNEPPQKTPVNINIQGEQINAEMDSEEDARRLARTLQQARWVAQ